MSVRIFYLIAFLLIHVTISSQAGIVAVGSDAGLPDKYITAICRDGRGLMWIGTRQGLCMYDGYRFLPLNGPLQNGTAITGLRYDAARDLLWAGTDKGLFSVKCTNSEVTALSGDSIRKNTAVTDICLFPDGRLFAAYKSGEIMLADMGNRMKKIAVLSPVNGVNGYAHMLERDGEHALSLQIAGRAYRLPVTGGALQGSDPDTVREGTFFRRLRVDTLFIGPGDGGLQIRDRRSYSHLFPHTSHLLAELRDIVDIHSFRPGILYVLGKPSTLYRIDLAAGRKDTIASDVFTGRLFTCFYFDPQGIIWLGSNKGLIKIADDQKLFDRLLLQHPSVSIRSLAADESGNIYAGTYSGLFVSKDRGRQFSRKNSMIPYGMLNVPGQYLYFVGEQRAFFRIEKRAVRAETGFYTTKGLPEDELRQAYALASDQPQGPLWIGTSYGLAQYDPATRVLSAYTNGASLPPNTEVRHIRIGQSNRLWLCTRSGLYELDKQKGVVWHMDTRTRPGLSANTVNYVDEDAEGRLWVCTDGGGINIISQDRKKVEVLKTEDGLSDNTTYHLLWQGDSRVWISTFNGLSSYDLKTGGFYNFYVADGLTSNEFNHNAFLRDDKGRMYFGTINGINAFYPDSIPRPVNAGRLFVSTITKWDTRTGAFINLLPADTAAAIILRPLDHSLTFNLAMTDYHNPESNIFRYRLKGLFNEWVSLSGQSALRLDGLAAGNYELEIKALDSRGAPALNTIRYRVEVRLPFYRSGWFYLGMFLLASGLLWAFFYLRLQQVRRVQRLREQIASDLHDEVGSLLTRITMTSDNLRFNKNNEDEKASKLQKIAALSRTAASSMSDILWAIDARNDYTGNLADRMREHAEEMLLPLDVDLQFDFQVNQRMSISSQLRQQLYLIYKEAVNNIVKHSKATDVQISYHHNEGGFMLRVINNGYVMKEKTSSKGQGLKNMTMRARRVQADCTAGPEGERFSVAVKGR